MAVFFVKTPDSVQKRVAVRMDLHGYQKGQIGRYNVKDSREAFLLIQ